MHPQPFATAEEAWFWYVQAYEAKASGARVAAGQGKVQRPCEPIDIYRTVDQLYRRRKLLRDHLHVLVHYGKRQMAPDPNRDREYQASRLWREAFDHLGPVLLSKSIIIQNINS